MAEEQGAIPESLERLFEQAFNDGIAAGKSGDESILAGSCGVYARSALAIVAADRLTDTGEDRYLAGYSEGSVAASREREWMQDKAWQDTVLMLVHYRTLAARTWLVGCGEAKAKLAEWWSHAEALAHTKSVEDIAALATHKTADAGAMRERCAQVADKLAENAAKLAAQCPRSLGGSVAGIAHEVVGTEARKLAAAIRNLPDAGEPL